MSIIEDIDVCINILSSREESGSQVKSLSFSDENQHLRVLSCGLNLMCGGWTWEG